MQRVLAALNLRETSDVPKNRVFRDALAATMAATGATESELMKRVPGAPIELRQDLIDAILAHTRKPAAAVLVAAPPNVPRAAPAPAPVAAPAAAAAAAAAAGPVDGDGERKFTEFIDLAASVDRVRQKVNTLLFGMPAADAAEATADLESMMRDARSVGLAIAADSVLGKRRATDIIDGVAHGIERAKTVQTLLPGDSAAILETTRALIRTAKVAIDSFANNAAPVAPEHKLAIEAAAPPKPPMDDIDRLLAGLDDDAAERVMYRDLDALLGRRPKSVHSGIFTLAPVGFELYPEDLMGVVQCLTKNHFIINEDDFPAVTAIAQTALFAWRRYRTARKLTDGVAPDGEEIMECVTRRKRGFVVQSARLPAPVIACILQTVMPASGHELRRRRAPQAH